MQTDIFQKPLIAGEMYLSINNTLIPVSPEGMRHLMDLNTQVRKRCDDLFNAIVQIADAADLLDETHKHVEEIKKITKKFVG
jgi:hypothetical protein